MIRSLQSKDLKNFIYFCQYRDPYSDFYVTKNNRRLFLNNAKVATQVFNDCLKSGDKCFIKEESDHISAVILIIGYKDKMDRKYVKMLTKNQDDCRDLFRFLQWQRLSNLFIKSRKNNVQFVKYDERLKDNKYTKGYKPSYFARKTGFRIIVVRDKEILLKKEEYKYNQNARR